MTSRFGVKGDLNVASEITLNGSGILGTINYLQTELDKINAITPNIQCLSTTSDNVISMQNPYIFNSIPYESNDYIGVYIGTYTLTGISTDHPIGFVVNNTDDLEVISGTPYNNPIIVENMSVQHYTGTIEIDVKRDFGTISYNCYNHGYMGGEKRLKFTSICQ